MQDCPLVSIIVTVYNRPEYLPLLMGSILGQSYKNTEVILVDDGSERETRDACDRYSDQDPRVKVVHKANAGVALARNTGLDSMNGEYVTFVDDDDFLAPDMVEFLLNKALEYDADVAYSDSVPAFSREIFEIKQDPLKVWVRTGREVLDDPHGWPVTPHHKLYKKKVFEVLRFPDIRTYEDLAVHIPVLYYTDRIVFTNRKNYYYYHSADSAMRRSFSVRRMDVMAAYEFLLSFISEYELGNNVQDRFIAAYYLRLSSLKRDVVLSDSSEKKEMLRIIEDKNAYLRDKVKGNPFISGKQRILRLFSFNCPKAFDYLYKITHKE